MSDYLWDKTGEADESVERLELLLADFRHRPRALELPAKDATRATLRARPGSAAHPSAPTRLGAARRLFGAARMPAPAWLAAASVLLLALLLGAFTLLRTRTAPDEGRTVAVSGRHAPPDTRAEPLPAPAPARQDAPPVQHVPAPIRREPQEVAGTQSEKSDVGAAVRALTTRERGGRLAVLPKSMQSHAPSPASASASTEASASSASSSSRGTRDRGDLLEAARAGGSGVAASLVEGTRLMTKEQLIYALRLTGAKLREVRMKSQGLDADAKPARSERAPGR